MLNFQNLTTTKLYLSNALQPSQDKRSQMEMLDALHQRRKALAFKTNRVDQTPRKAEHPLNAVWAIVKSAIDLLVIVILGIMIGARNCALHLYPTLMRLQTGWTCFKNMDWQSIFKSKPHPQPDQPVTQETTNSTISGGADTLTEAENQSEKGNEPEAENQTEIESAVADEEFEKNNSTSITQKAMHFVNKLESITFNEALARVVTRVGTQKTDPNEHTFFKNQKE